MIFIDTNVFIARYVSSDQYHEKTRKSLNKAFKKLQKVYTSNFVIDETLTLLARRTHYSFAADTGRKIYESSFITILRPDRIDEVKALNLMEKYADQRISFTDCVSFALMQRYRIKQVFTFDHHFQLAGFSLWR